MCRRYTLGDVFNYIVIKKLFLLRNKCTLYQSVVNWENLIHGEQMSEQAAACFLSELQKSLLVTNPGAVNAVSESSLCRIYKQITSWFVITLCNAIVVPCGPARTNVGSRHPIGTFRFHTVIPILTGLRHLTIYYMNAPPEQINP